jgi:spore cortex formation protein SpoVR/YcgB (stage V sporulation)
MARLELRPAGHLPSGDSPVAEFYRLDTYPNQIEVITAEQMMDAYSSVGMPIGYHHWSFGKRFIHTERNYKRGQMGLAYEIVINSDPCIAYLMEENTMPMQALVMAHACYGHNSFFKNNYLFKTWTDASSIIDYLLFAKNYITECEEKHGIDAVEKLLDSCHA